MKNYSIIILHLITLTLYNIQLTNGFSYQAGHCSQGDLSGKFSGHGESGSGILAQGSLSVSFDGVPLQAYSTTSEVNSGQLYTVVLQGNALNQFRGFLFRLSGVNGEAVDPNILQPSNNSNNQVQTHPYCGGSVSGVTHTNGVDKQRVEFSFETFAPAGTKYRLEITVVRARAWDNWFYQNHVLNVVDAPKLTTAPSSAPSQELSQTPSQAPSDPSITMAPSQEPSQAPSMAPSQAPSEGEPPVPCFDPPFVFKMKKRNGGRVWKTCEWASWNINRCKVKKVAITCPEACRVCNNDDFCKDTKFKFKINRNGKIKIKTCDWVAEKKDFRCTLSGVCEDANWHAYKSDFQTVWRSLDDSKTQDVRTPQSLMTTF